MNKECIVVQYFIRDYKDEFILNKSIDSYQKMNLDIILISHSPIPESIQKKVKYFLYDSDDELVTFNDAYYNPKVIIETCKRFNFDNKTAAPFLFVVDDLAYTFYKAVYNIYKFVTNMGYDYSYYFIGDNIINDDDIKKIIEIKNDVLLINKFGYFEVYNLSLSPFFWFVNNNWFLENGFPILTNKNEFFDCLETNCVYEQIIFNKLLKSEKDIIIKYLDEFKVSFLDDEKFDLSKKYTDGFYNNSNNDVGIFYEFEKPYIIAFSFSPEIKNWRLTVEYNNNIYKYDVNDIRKNEYKIIPIKEIESDQFRIRCEDMNKKKIKYDIFINDIEKYKRVFRIHQTHF